MGTVTAGAIDQIAAAPPVNKDGVGQMYRYFLNKEAIIEAIVENIVAERLAWIETTGGSVDLAALLAQRTVATAKAALSDDTALLIEANAEAARNPAVAKIVKAADKRLHERAAAMVKQDYPHWEDGDIVARVEILAVIAEGTAAHDKQESRRHRNA